MKNSNNRCVKESSNRPERFDYFENWIIKHPSGDIQPSGADSKLTTKLANAGKMLDIEVLDHLIIADDQFYSYADNRNL